VVSVICSTHAFLTYTWSRWVVYVHLRFRRTEIVSFFLTEMPPCPQ